MVTLLQKFIAKESLYRSPDIRNFIVHIQIQAGYRGKENRENYHSHRNL